jgi:hypothetical protein
MGLADLAAFADFLPDQLLNAAAAIEDGTAAAVVQEVPAGEATKKATNKKKATSEKCAYLRLALALTMLTVSLFLDYRSI